MIDAEAVELGIRGERVPVGSHVAYMWENQEEFLEAIGVLEAGLRSKDHLVVFGHDEANARVLDALVEGGADVERLREERRLDVLGPGSSGEETLAGIGRSFEAAVEGGAPMIRLLGNIGWGRDAWPDTKELMRFEARVTEAAASFPCLVVCMYDVRSLPADVLLHGAFQTHPLTFCGNLVRENPFHCSLNEFLERVDAL
ncbi:MAG: MEDS domain-containing protein [Gemmatimonadetes bacterium]|nr:MEDS domain-containing protein [Gemmatimonadota bacterium]